MLINALRARSIVVASAVFLALVGTGFAEDLTKLDVTTLRTRADAGDAAAQCGMGYHYSKGIGVEKDFKKAVEWFQKSADQGNADGQFALSYLYARGKGVPLDMIKSVELTRKAAEQGLAQAQTILGLDYSSGTIVQKDPIEAAKWFQRAVDQGEPQAQYYLGLYYGKGLGVVEDNIKSMQLIRLSAEQGVMEAQSILGSAFHEGVNGVPKDYIQSYMWLWLAAFQGKLGAASELKVLEKVMPPDDIEKAKAMAHDWKPKSASSVVPQIGDSKKQ